MLPVLSPSIPVAAGLFVFNSRVIVSLNELFLSSMTAVISQILKCKEILLQNLKNRYLRMVTTGCMARYVVSAAECC